MQKKQDKIAGIKRTQVYFDIDVWDEYKAYADKMGISFAGLVRIALAKYFENEGRK
jgi:hypothetical protein